MDYEELVRRRDLVNEWSRSPSLQFVHHFYTNTVVLAFLWVVCLAEAFLMLGEHFVVLRGTGTVVTDTTYQNGRIRDMFLVSCVLLWTQFALDLALVVASSTPPVMPCVVLLFELIAAILLSSRDTYDLYSDHAAAAAYFRLIRALLLTAHLMLFYNRVQCFLFCQQGEVENYGTGATPLLSRWMRSSHQPSQQQQQNEMPSWPREKDVRYNDLRRRQEQADAADPGVPPVVPLTAAERAELAELKKGRDAFDALGLETMRSTPASPARKGVNATKKSGRVPKGDQDAKIAKPSFVTPAGEETAKLHAAVDAGFTGREVSRSTEQPDFGTPPPPPLHDPAMQTCTACGNALEAWQSGAGVQRCTACGKEASPGTTQGHSMSSSDVTSYRVPSTAPVTELPQDLAGPASPIPVLPTPTSPPPGYAPGAWYDPPSTHIRDTTFHTYLSPELQKPKRLSRRPPALQS